MAGGDHGVSRRALVASRPAVWPRRRLHPRQRSQLALVVEQHGACDDVGVCRRLLACIAARAPSRASTFIVGPRLHLTGSSLEHSLSRWGRSTRRSRARILSTTWPARGSDDGPTSTGMLRTIPIRRICLSRGSGTTRPPSPNPDTPRITFKNLEVLTEYLRRPELLYKGQPRRVILSEQGFHTPDGPDGRSDSGSRLLLCLSQNCRTRWRRCVHFASARGPSA